jgi:hypothetical protein
VPVRTDLLRSAFVLRMELVATHARVCVGVCWVCWVSGVLVCCVVCCWRGRGAEGQRGDGWTSFFRPARVFSLLFATVHRRTTTKPALEPPGNQQAVPRRVPDQTHFRRDVFTRFTAATVSSGTRSWTDYHTHDVSRSAFIGGRALRGLEAPVVPTVFLSRIPLLSIRQDFGTPMSTFLTHSLPCLEWVMANPHH